jgi:hypothetical protein
MKALPPPPSQLDLWNRRRELIAVEKNESRHVVRALAEILLAAADLAALPGKERADEAP